MSLVLPVVINSRIEGRNLAAPAPDRAHAADAGLDLFTVEDFTLFAGQTRVVDTGISVAIPEGHAGLILPRSGMAAESNITIVNSPGLIDAGYRGPVKVILHKLWTYADDEDKNDGNGTTYVQFHAGHKIAQLLVVPFAYCVPVLHWNLPEPSDNRGEGGFGSSGR